MAVAAEITGELHNRGLVGSSGLLQVWLVDDSENFRTLLGALLEDEGGIECARQFPTAETALEALKHETAPDVILLDVRMPGMGGVAAVAPIKQLAPATQVLMLTTFFDGQVKKQALQDGAADLLLKSLSVEQIVERVRLVHRHPERFPTVDILEDTEPATSDWMDRRVADVKNGRFSNPDVKSQPETGRPDASGNCISNRLVRGVNYLRSIVQGIGRKEISSR